MTSPPETGDPITFSCRGTFSSDAGALCRQIADVNRWPDFDGWEPLPGIREAHDERRTETVAGSVIRVTNRDGTRHRETIVEWRDGCGATLRLDDFAPPLAWFADHFVETWELQEASGTTRAERHFALYPRNRVGSLALRGVAWLLRQAVSRHMNKIAAG